MAKPYEIAFRIRQVMYAQVSRAEMQDKWGFSSDELEEFLKLRTEERGGGKTETIEWFDVKERLPDGEGEYLVTYHPCFLEDVEEGKVKVGMDTYYEACDRGIWSKTVWQRTVAWAKKPMPYLGPLRGI